MKTLSMWSFSGGRREIGVHDVDPELFEKLRPAFDKLEDPLAEVGRISFDEDTIIFFFKKQDEKEETTEELEASDRVARLIRKG
jgi:hypothetical protein